MPTDSINRQPFGLLGFLGIKNGGRNPESLSTQLQPVWPLEALYYRTNMQTARVAQSLTGVGMASAWVQVPQGEVWAVHGGMVQSTAALGAGVTVAGFMAAAPDPQAGSFNVTPLGEIISATTPSVFVSPWKWPVVQYLPPGCAIGFYCTQLVAGPVPMTMQLWYSQLVT